MTIINDRMLDSTRDQEIQHDGFLRWLKIVEIYAGFSIDADHAQTAYHEGVRASDYVLQVRA